MSHETKDKPAGYAVVNDQGYFIGIWGREDIVGVVCAKGQSSHHEKVVPLYARPMEQSKDADRLDWLEQNGKTGRLEFARSLFGTGFEFGYWSKSGPVAEVHAGNLREAIDKTMSTVRK